MNPIRVLARRLLIGGTLGFFLCCVCLGALATDHFTPAMNVVLLTISGMGAGAALVGLTGGLAAQRLSEEIQP